MILTTKELIINLSTREALVLDTEPCRGAGIPVGLDPHSLFVVLTNNASSNAVPSLDELALQSLMVGSIADEEAQAAGMREIKKGGFFGKLASAWNAVTGPRCSDADFTGRLTVWCRNCDLRIVEGDKEYCGGCGCPHWRMSELSTQLRFAEFECPIRKFGKVKAE